MECKCCIKHSTSPSTLGVTIPQERSSFISSVAPRSANHLVMPATFVGSLYMLMGSESIYKLKFQLRPGGPLGTRFFLLRTALKDRPKGPPTAHHQPPPTANRHQPLTATNHQPSTANNQQQRPTAYRQPLATATNHQSPITNRHQPPVANCRVVYSLGLTTSQKPG